MSESTQEVLNISVLEVSIRYYLMNTKILKSFRLKIKEKDS